MKIEPYNPKLYYKRGDAYDESGKTNLAVNDFNKAIEHANLAINDFNKAIELDINYA